MSTMVIVPTYNERENIEQLLSALLANDHELQIVVVDDNSPDGTGDIVASWATTEPRIHCIHRASKLGLGTAYIAGFTYALDQGADYVLSMDADFSHHPRFIAAMLSRSQDVDVVIGSRYVRGGGTRNCTFSRKLLSRSANIVAKVLLGLHAHDCTAGFRCYRASVLEGIDYRAIQSNGYSYLIEMLYAVQTNGYTVAEIPILFEDRRFGTSKISSNEISKAAYTLIRLFRRRVGSLFSRSRKHAPANEPAILK